MFSLCSCQMLVYPGKRKVKDLIKFLDKEMEKAKKDRVKVNHLPHYSAPQTPTPPSNSGLSLYDCVCLRAAFFFCVKNKLVSFMSSGG